MKYGKKEATEEELAKAAEIAQAIEFINAKPESFRTEISQGGTNVSGGQKQRLSIARALTKNRKSSYSMIVSQLLTLRQTQHCAEL